MNSTRPAIVASRSLVRGQPTERQSGEDRSATPSERTGEENGAVTCTPPRRLSPASYDWSNDRVERCRREATGLAGASDPSAGPVCTPTRHATTGRCVSKEPWRLAMARACLNYPACPPIRQRLQTAFYAAGVARGGWKRL